MLICSTYTYVINIHTTCNIYIRHTNIYITHDSSYLSVG